MRLGYEGSSISFSNDDPCANASIGPIIGSPMVDTSCAADPLMDDPSAYINVDSADGCLERVTICSYELDDRGCADPDYFRIYTITWCAFYRGGIRRSFEQVVRIQRPTFSSGSIMCPDTQVYCLADTDPDAIGRPSIDGHEIGKQCKIMYQYDDWVVQMVDGCTTKIVRTWTLVDWCTLAEVQCMQEILVVDTVPPEIIQCPEDDTLKVQVNDAMGWCKTSFPLVKYPATDECSGEEELVKYHLVNGQIRKGNYVDLDIGLHTVQYIVADACQNEDTCTFYVEVADNPPQIGCASLVNYTLPANQDSVCLHIDFLPLDITENCSDLVEVLVGRDTMQLDSCLPLTCLDLNDTIKYWVKATNSEGLSSFGWCEIFVKGDGNILLDCSDLPEISLPCDEVPADLEDLYSLFGSPQVILIGQACPPDLDSVTVIDTCNNFGTITRTWYLIGTDGSTRDSCSQRISITVGFEDRPSVYGGNTNIMRCECFDTVNVNPIILSDCSISPDVNITNNSPYAFDSGADASGDYPVGVHLVEYTITGDCFDPLSLVDTITVIDNVTKTTNGSDCLPPDEWADVYNRNVLGPEVMSLFIINEDCEVDFVTIQDVDTMVAAPDTTYTITWTYTDTSGNVSPNSTHVMIVSPNCQGRKASTDVMGRIDAARDRQKKQISEPTSLRAQNHPNPFEDYTVIKFHNAHPGKVVLEVMDMEGKVHAIQTKLYPEGDQQFRFQPGRDMSKGILFYKLITPTHAYTGKMIWRH